MKYAEALKLAIKALASEMSIYKMAYKDFEDNNTFFTIQADLYNQLDDAREIIIKKYDELKDQE